MRRLAAVAVVTLAFAGATTSASAAPSSIVRAQLTLPTGPYLFGEQIAPTVDVLVDTKLADPKAMQVETRFFPYQAIGAPRRTVTRDGSVADVRYRYVLACPTLQCLTGSTFQRKIQFTPVRIQYRDRAGHSWKRTLRWPAIREISRVGSDLIPPATASEAGFNLTQSPLLRFPASVVAPSPSYRVSPLVLGLVLAGLALALLVAAAFLARPLLALLRRKREADGPELTPLEQALDAVDQAARKHAGGPEHREALGLLARELREAQLPDLVRTARQLAWSETAPSAAASRSLAGDVRAALGSAG